MLPSDVFMFFFGMASLVLVLMCISIIFSYVTHDIPKQIGKHYALIFIPITLCSLCLFGASVHSKISRDSNIGASLNVGCVHQMKHLRHIYAKAPCHKVTKPCSKSLSKVYSASQKKQLTKHEIFQRYKKIKKVYKHTSQTSSRVNGSKSLHPRAPHWYEYL